MSNLGQEKAMKKRMPGKQPTRMVLMLMLAVVLPAAGLIGFSVLHLASIQRNSGIEALFQRDFYHTLGISEKQINHKAFDMIDGLRRQFPNPGTACESSLDQLLEKNSFAAHLFVYNPERGLVYRPQPARMNDPEFRSEREQVQELAGWIKGGYESMIKEFEKMDEKGKLPVYFDHMMVSRGEKHHYISVAWFLVPPSPGVTPSIGAMAFDADFLRDHFFPEMLNSLLTENAGQDRNHAVMMVHVKGDSSPTAVSAEWDGGYPEVERPLDGAFPGMILGIKLRGTTLAALGQHFIRTEFLILSVLSLLMAGGIVLTYRNVNKEMALARLKSDFVSNVSHELRTPLALIRLYAETLEMGRLTNKEKFEEYYRIIRKESERLTALINNILDFSRIEAGRKEYDFRDTDIAELVRNTLESYRYQIEQNGFAFQENIADDVPPVKVDREAIARSLLNLVNNALKYSQKDKFLNVNLYRENGSVKLEVVDHGIGIPKSEQHKIFEKFYRVGDPLVHTTKGSGLGLSLVRHIVHAHGGDVSVESAPGQGSKFTIVLPVDSEGINARTAS